jgi:hypothetical protein
MTSSKAKFQRIAQRLEHVRAWRASGETLAAYAQRSGQSVSQLRAWLGWETRWRAQLQARDVLALGGSQAFVQVVPPRAKAGTKAIPNGHIPAHIPAHTATHAVAGGLTVTLTRVGSALSASAHWPSGATLASAAWLREVLA